MNREQSDEIGRLIHGTWPSVLRWFASLDAGVQEIQRERRRAIFAPLEASDVRRAIEELCAVAVPPWQQFGDRPEQAYAAIAEHSRRFAHARRDASESSRSIADSRGKGPLFARTMREDADELAGATKAGSLFCAADIRAWLDRDQDLQARDRRDEVLCVLCGSPRPGEGGLVRVLSTIKWLERDGRRWLAWTTAVAACRCIEGERYASRKDERANLATYCDATHVRVVPFATEEDVLAELRATRERAEKAKRVASFDAFNQRGAEANRSMSREESFT